MKYDTRTQFYAHAHVKHARACVFLCARVRKIKKTSPSAPAAPQIMA